VTLIRMIRSLIMTRLLFPEVYGLMTLVWRFLPAADVRDTGSSARSSAMREATILRS